MIEEIIYTSAPKGLKAGSRGFCTVVSTAGMAVNTAERLESMSGYRHAFPMQDPKAPLNPVNYSHVTLRIGGRNVHVISRVADAGQDYSGRTNKLAHHLVIDDVSQFTVGPARLMTQSGVLVSQWDGNTRNIPPRNLPIPLIPPSIELKAWKTVTGDSGWAGWVAEQLTKDKTPVSVIFAAGTDTLALVQEVLDVLAPSQRWSVTFSTYFTKMLAGTECQLRFVLDDTPEATAIRNDARAKVVDLTKTLSPATGGAIVAQARSGRIVMTESPPPVQRPAIPTWPAAPSRVEQPAAEKDEAIEIPAIRGAMPDMPGFQSPSLPPAIANLFDSDRPTKERWAGWWKYAAIALALVATSSLITVLVMKQKNRVPETAEVEGSGRGGLPQVGANVELRPPRQDIAVNDNLENGRITNESLPKNVESGAAADTHSDGESIADGNKSTASSSQETSASGSDVSQAASPGVSKDLAHNQDSKPDPFAVAKDYSNSDGRKKFVDAHGTLLLATSPPGGDSVDFPILVAQPQLLEIEFLKSFQVGINHSNGLRIACKKNTDPKTGSIMWTVRIGLEDADPNTWSKMGQLSLVPPSKPLAQEGATHVLRFEWDPAAKTNRDAEFIRWCPIRISADGVIAAVLLRPAHMTTPIETPKPLGSEASQSYALQADAGSFEGIDLKNVQGVTVEMTFTGPDHEEVKTTVPGTIHFRSSPPLTKFDPENGLPEGIKLATIFTLTWVAEGQGDVHIDLEQRIRLRALGIDGKKLKNLQRPKLFGASSSEVNYWFTSNNSASVVSEFNATAMLDGFANWFEFSPAKKSAIEDQAKAVNKALAQFKGSISAAKEAIPKLKQGEDDSATPDGQARHLINDFDTQISGAVGELTKQAEEVQVKGYRDELETMKKWLDACKLRSSVYASFDVEKAAPVTVYFLETLAGAEAKQ